MAEGNPVIQLASSAEFLRRIACSDHIKRGVVKPRAFMCNKETSLSFTKRDARLHQEAGLLEYQEHNKLKNGILPGVCGLESKDFLDAIGCVPLPEEDSADALYGKLHHTTPCPDNEITRRALADRAILLLELVKPIQTPPEPL